ncbi:MAG: glycosyltransferase family 2 protein [Erysipelotrichales bacterium]|nr:glycosyltransferase family 2 protein [Erysipelotrichales bacterium]
MKYISFVVPSYNAEKYLDKSIPSLLKGGEDVEIIIVNDGSKDNTLAVAREYEKKHPSIVRVIDKPNGGHGSGINAGLAIAEGLYFKCVDADDWVDEDALKKTLDLMKKHYEENKSPDLYLTNYVFERPDLNQTRKSGVFKEFPQNRFFTWDDVKHVFPTRYLMMHMLIFKTSILKESKVKLIEHTFYVDNLFNYVPLFYTKTMYYLDVDLYRYFVGRQDQSVSFANMAKNYQHQLRVIREMSLWYTLDELKSLSRKHYKFMINDLEAKSFLTLFYITIGNKETAYKEYKEYLKEFKEKNKKLYKKIRHHSLFTFPFILIRPLRNAVVKFGYKKVIKKTGWN